MKKLFKVAIAIYMLLSATISYALEDAYIVDSRFVESDNMTSGGVYIGINVGKASYDVDINDLYSAAGLVGVPIYSAYLDDSDTSLAFTLGYQLNPNVSFEGGYINLGEIDFGFTASIDIYDIDLDASVETSGLFFDIKGQVPINNKFSVFGKLGLLMWETDINMTASNASLGSQSESLSEDGDDVFYGIGASVNLNDNNSVALNIDYTLYSLDDLDVDVLSIGILVGF